MATHRLDQATALDPFTCENTNAEPTAATHPRGGVRARCPRVPLRERPPQKCIPQLFRLVGAVLAVEAAHVRAAVHQARARLGGKVLAHDEQYFTRQEERNGVARRNRGAYRVPYPHPVGAHAGAHDERVVHRAHRHLGAGGRLSREGASPTHPARERAAQKCVSLSDPIQA